MRPGDKETECCGNCKYHQYEMMDDDWVCMNPDSDFFTDWMEFNHSCENWEERE